MAYKALRAIQSLLLIFPVIFSWGAAPGSSAAPDAARSLIAQPAGGCVDPGQSEYVFWRGRLHTCRVISVNGEKRVRPGPMEEISVIIQLPGDPIAAFKAGLQTPLPLAPDRAALMVTRYAEQLESRQEKTIQELSSRGLLISAGQSYGYVFNGFQATVRMGDLDVLRNEPGVAGVHLDLQVHELLNESVPLIGADQVWLMPDASGENVTGKGIEVAIIDTGIDYTHPDLGAGFGAGNKVAGGFDFVNADSDPMDDNGHGTHVAGIVAAKGVLTGVAPDASLFAYKVLNEDGWGYEGDVIAAIEIAANPDGDPVTEDAHDVINLSLGGPGTPDGAMSQAVEAAVQAGVLVAAAAGNDGPGYWSIASPGLARGAVTVGASDKSDLLAEFSSRGPIRNYYGMVKPDILAPGVDIYSTVPIEGEHGDPSRYAVLSGTSMAAPHVAGAAALIKQLHPDWSPEMIRAGLTNDARALHMNVFAQGSGRVRVEKTARSKSLVEPALISFGQVDHEATVWTKTRAIAVTNGGKNARNYSIQLQAPLAEGASLSITPASFTLDAGQSRDVVLELTVQNNILPIRSEDPFNYEGSLQVQSGTQIDLVRISFFRSAILQVTFDEVPLDVMVLNDEGFFWWGFGPGELGTDISIMLGPGKYDIIVDYDAVSITQVFRELVPVETTSHVTIHKSEARHRITITPVDAQGNLIREGLFEGVFFRPRFIFSYALNGSLEDLQLKFSEVSSRYPWLWFVSTAEQNIGPIYNIFGQIADGIRTSRLFENDPADFGRIVLQYFPPPTRPLLAIVHFNMLHWGASGAGTAYYDPSDEPLRTPFMRELYIVSLSEEGPGFFTFWESVVVPKGMDLPPELFVTPQIRYFQNGHIEAYWCGIPEPVNSTDVLYLPIGLGPAHWYGQFDNQEAALRIIGPRGCGAGFLFLNQAQDVSLYPDVAYALYRGGELVQEGILPAPLSGEDPAVDVQLGSPGQYSFEVTFPHYFIQRKNGTAFLKAEFDTRKIDKNPPTLLSLNVLADGKLVNSLPVHSESQIQFSIHDDVQLDRVNLYYRSLEGAAWQQLPLDAAGDQYTAAIPLLPGGAWIDVRIDAVDSSGNRLEYEVQPAFRMLESMFLPVAVQQAVP